MTVAVYFAEYEDLKFLTNASSKLNVVFIYCAMKSEFSLAKPFQEIFVFGITVVNTHSGFTRGIVVSMEIGNH